VVVLLRQYLQTIALFAAGIFLGWPLWLIITGVLFAAIIDFTVVGRSSELALYQQDPRLLGATQLPTGPARAARWQIAAVIVSAGIASAAAAIDADAVWQGLTDVCALLVACTIGSIFGFRVVRNPKLSRQDLAERIESLPDALFIVNLLPRRASRLVGSIARFALGIICILPFLAALRSIRQVPPGVAPVLIMLGLAAFFQLGFALLSQALFSLRWWRGNGGLNNMEIDRNSI
jgi:hypothetical protein